jgi:mRNA interferase MazF
MNRGDVVILVYPFSQGSGAKARPGLVVQNDRDNQRLSHTIVAMITGNLRNVGQPTQLLVDPATPEGKSSGLHAPSAIKCTHLHSVEQADVIKIIGRLPAVQMNSVDACLKVALGLP